MNLTVHQIHINCQARTPIRLNEHKGSAIRGALFQALRGPTYPRASWSGFCVNKEAASCLQCSLNVACPVMRLVSTLDERGIHGDQAPRPYIINPPLEPRTSYAPGDHFSFDLLLVGEASNLFPYVVLALMRLEHEGIGAIIPEQDGRRRRGTAQITRIDTLNPLTGEYAAVLRADEHMVQVPALPVTHSQVLAVAGQLPTHGELTLYFLTPLRLVDQGGLVKVPYFRPLFHRLIERIKSLAENFGGGPVPYEIRTLRDLANEVSLVENHTSWVDLKGYSTRLGRQQVIGGLVGWATYHAAEWSPFLPWLVWGTLLHVGKNVVKGDGWFGIEAGGVRVGLPGWPSGSTLQTRMSEFSDSWC